MKRLPVLIILAVVSVLLLSSCTDTKPVEKSLQRAEADMEDSPKAVLEQLDSLDRSSLTTRKLKAKYALLYSMALDKNYIDLQNDSIIAPAVEYYRRHGSADDRLKTYYYWGRIEMNAENREGALRKFIEAEPFVSKAKDKRAVARLYRAQMQIYQYAYDTDMTISTAVETASYFKLAGDTVKYINSLNDVVTGYLLKQDTMNIRICLDEIKSYWDILTQRQKSNWYSAMLLQNEFTRSFDAEGMISEYLDSIPDVSKIRWLSVVNAYYYSGNLQKASDYLEKAAFYEGKYSSFYDLMSGHINADLENYRQASDSYRSYISETGEKNGKLFDSDINFLKERHDLEFQLIWKNFMLVILLLCVVLLSLIAVLIIFRIRLVKKEKQLADERNRADLELAAHRQIADRLKHEREKKQLETERDNYVKMYDDTLLEVERLNNALNAKVLDSTSRKYVVERLELLNKFIAADMIPGSSDEATEELQKLINDKERFIESTRHSFSLAYPKFIKILEKHRLTESEIGFCCFYMIGLKGKDIANYLGVSQSAYYKFSRNIRMKFGLEEKDTNLDLFLRQIFENSLK